MLLSQENRENDADDLREKMNNSRSALEERIIKEKQVTKNAIVSVFKFYNINYP